MPDHPSRFMARARATIGLPIALGRAPPKRLPPPPMTFVVPTSSLRPRGWVAWHSTEEPRFPTTHFRDAFVKQRGFGAAGLFVLGAVLIGPIALWLTAGAGGCAMPPRPRS